jgi:hypothetical protein
MEVTEKEQAWPLGEMRKSNWGFYGRQIEWARLCPRNAALKNFGCWDDGALTANAGRVPYPSVR